MSAPEAACAWAITAWDGYLPVPTMRREAKVRPAMTNGSLDWLVSMAGRSSVLARAMARLAAADEVHDLDLVAVADDGRVVGGLLDDELVALDRDPAGVDRELLQQPAHADRLGEVERVAVQADGHDRKSTATPTSAARRRARPV